MRKNACVREQAIFNDAPNDALGLLITSESRAPIQRFFPHNLYYTTRMNEYCTCFLNYFRWLYCCLFLVTGCRSEQIAFRFHSAPAVRVASATTPRKMPAIAGSNLSTVPLAPQPNNTSLKHASSRLHSQRRIIHAQALPQIFRLSEYSPTYDTLKQVKPSKKHFVNNKFMRPGWRDTDTKSALVIMGFSALTIASIALGASISGFWGIMLLIVGLAIFLPLIPLSIWGACTDLFFQWPSNIIYYTVLIFMLAAIPFGIIAGASLGLVSWLPLAALGVFSVLWGGIN